MSQAGSPGDVTDVARQLVLGGIAEQGRLDDAALTHHDCLRLRHDPGAAHSRPAHAHTSARLAADGNPVQADTVGTGSTCVEFTYRRMPSVGAMTAEVFDNRLRIAVVIGSVRRPRMAEPLAAWLERELGAAHWLDLDVIDLASVSLPMHAMQAGGAAASPIAHRLADADGFVFLTPEYNHSFPAPVKNVIDWHMTEWAYKPVAFVGYGGSGGIRAIEQLRAVFPELRATTVRESVLLPMPWEHLDADGRFVPPPGADQALHATMRELRAWAQALRSLRAADPAGRT
ncbi:NADPH-dependent FMN reductase [Streptomyces eurythermus]